MSDIPLFLPVSKEEKVKKINVEIDRDFSIVSSSFNIEVRDQKSRPTCSSFSGIRAIEIEMAQKNKYKDLSEQYLYFASKPNCQNMPCSKRGSWVGHGLEFSKNQSGLDIPIESNCPYYGYSKSGNETQIPLSKSCKTGVVSVKSFSYLRTLDEVVSKLESGKSVIASVKLTPNFYENSGLVLMNEKNKGNRTDSHAFGHSILLNGIIKLPEALNEGKYCFVTTNSWGKGWGLGGYSCLSEKWILSQRQSNPFVVIKSINI